MLMCIQQFLFFQLLIFSCLCMMHLSSAFLGRGTPRLPGGNQLKLKKSAPQYPGLSGLLGLFLARGLGHFQASVGGCHCLPLSHCLSDLPRVETCFQIMPEGSEN